MGDSNDSGAAELVHALRRRHLLDLGLDPDSRRGKRWIRRSLGAPLYSDLEKIPLLHPPKPLPMLRPSFDQEPTKKPPRDWKPIANRDPKVKRPEGPCSVYRAYDQFGVLLYVGITSRGVWRMHQHGYRSLWWPKMARMEWEHFSSRQEAIDRETTLIYSLDPLFNEVRPTPWKERGA